MTDPFKLAERLRTLIEAAPLCKTDQSGHIVSVREQEGIKRALADGFGERMGWVLTGGHTGRRTFTPQMLARRTTGHQRDDDYILRDDFNLFDHPYAYKWPTRPFRCAGIVSHPYQVPADLEDRARQIGLKVERVQDWPSWWYPGSTVALCFTPLRIEPYHRAI